MEVTLGQIFASFNLIGRIVDQSLPIKLAWRFTKLIKGLNQEYQSLEKLRDGLVRKHGEEVEGQGRRFTASPKKAARDSCVNSKNFSARKLKSIGT